MISIIVLWILLAIIAVIVILLHFSVSVYLKYDGDFVMNIKYMFFNIYPRKPKEKRRKKSKKTEKEDINNLPEAVEGPKTDLPSEQAYQEFEDNIEDDFSSSDYDDIISDYIESDEQAYEALTGATVKSDNAEDLKASDKSETAAEVKRQVKTKKKSDKKERINKSDTKNIEQPKEESTLQKLKKRYRQIKPYLPMGWKYFKKLLKAVRITGIDVNIDIGREDAHEAAIYYGAVQGTLFNLLGILSNVFTVRIKKANVNCNFINNTIDGEGECYVQVRPSTIIAIVFCIAVNFGFIFLEQKIKNKRYQDKKSNDEIKIENNVEVS